MTDRYQVRDGSESAHCCFSATVVDTHNPVMIGGKEYAPNGVPSYVAVCECFEDDDAKRICVALNALEAK